MSEPEISPLAKRLAEENNVDWRKLAGTGTGGKVVERDVLEYLARVMAGEEDVNPTPEPLPDGMEEWPEEDIAAYRRGAREKAAAANAHDLEAAPSDDPDEIGEDIFLFDDEDEDVAEVDTSDDVFAQTGGTEIADDDGLFLDLEESEEAGRPMSDLGSLEVGAEPDDSRRDRADAAFGSMSFAFDDVEDDNEDFGTAPREADAAAAEPEVADWQIADVAEEHAAEEHAADAELGGFGGFADEPDREGAPQAGAAGDRFGGGGVGAAARPAGGPEAPADEDTVWGEAAGAAAGLEPAAPAPTAADVPAEEPLYEDRTPAGVAPDLPLATHGRLLRRHVDVTSVAAAQVAVSRELGFDEPVPLGTFLARAAVKARVDNPLAGGRTVVANIEGGLTFRTVEAAADTPFRDMAGRRVGGVPQLPDGAGLIVVDLSPLGIDEAVLDMSVPVLSLGRILYDDAGGGARSAIALSGDVDAEAGGRFLAAVAELLETPVRLLV